jgi:hypothetical protein
MEYLCSINKFFKIFKKPNYRGTKILFQYYFPTTLFYFQIYFEPGLGKDSKLSKNK